MAFDISMGVRKGDVALRTVIDAELDRNRAAIDLILAAYRVPPLPKGDDRTRAVGDEPLDASR